MTPLRLAALWAALGAALAPGCHSAEPVPDVSPSPAMLYPGIPAPAGVSGRTPTVREGVEEHRREEFRRDHRMHKINDLIPFHPVIPSNSSYSSATPSLTV